MQNLFIENNELELGMEIFSNYEVASFEAYVNEEVAGNVEAIESKEEANESPRTELRSILECLANQNDPRAIRKLERFCDAKDGELSKANIEAAVARIIENETDSAKARIMINAYNKIKREAADQVPVINNSDHFEAILSGKMKKGQRSIHSLEVDIDKDHYRASAEVTKVSDSRIYNHSVMESAEYKTRHFSQIVMPKKFTNTFLSLSITTDAKEKADALFGGIIVKIQQDNGWVTFLTDEGTDMKRFVDLSTGKHYSSIDELPKGEIHIYKGLTWTASAKRQYSYVMMKVNGPEGDIRFNILDKETLEALRVIYKKYSILKEYRSDVQKALGYAGNVATGSVNVGKVRGYARFHLKWLNDTQEFFLHKAYAEAKRLLREAKLKGNLAEIEEAIKGVVAIETCKTMLDDLDKQPTADGKMFVCAEELAELLSAYFGMIVKPEAITGMMIQLRPGTIKASADIVSRDVLNALIKSTREMCVRDGLDPDKYVTIHGDENHIMYLADKNCIKLDYNVLSEISMEILAFGKRSRSTMSKQLCESIVFAGQQVGKDTLPLIIEALKITVEEKLANLTVAKKAKVLTPEQNEEAMESGFVDNIILSRAPRHIMESKALYSSVWKQAINSITDVIDRMAADMKAFNRRLSSDPAFIITAGKIRGVLNLGEIFINDKRVTKTVMIKYPKMGLREFYASNNVTLKEIIKRCNRQVKNGVITMDEADTIIEYYRSCDSYKAVLPPQMLVAAIEAGLDFDYDGASIMEYTKKPKTRIEEITNEIVDTFHQVKMMAVVIDTDPIEKIKDRQGNTVIAKTGHANVDIALEKAWSAATAIMDARK